MKKKLLGSLLAALFVVGLMAPAALAKDDAGLFQGVAKVGAKFDPANDCGNDGTGVPIGKGLYLPTINDHNAVYSLAADVTSVFNGLGKFAVCGYLTKVAGIGAACGWTKGHNGQGKASWDTKVKEEGVWYDVNNIHWKFSPGGLIIVSGDVIENDAGTKNETDKMPGALLVVVQAAVDDAQCADFKPNNGENDITVAGVYWVDQNGVLPNDQNEITEPLSDPKDDGKSCNSILVGKQCEEEGDTNIWGDKKKPE